jgi:hypothetical protein
MEVPTTMFKPEPAAELPVNKKKKLANIRVK